MARKVRRTECAPWASGNLRQEIRRQERKRLDGHQFDSDEPLQDEDGIGKHAADNFVRDGAEQRISRR